MYFSAKALSLLKITFFDTLGADINLFRMAFEENAHLLQIRQEFAFGPAGNLTSGPAFAFILPFARNQFSGKRVFSA
jgi:hypothetical protein